MNRAAAARLVALASLAVVLSTLLWPPVRTVGAVAALPVAALLFAGLRPRPRWGGWVAVLMIPYFCAAAMNALAGPMDRVSALLLAGGSTIALLASLDWTRRMGFSLRR